MRAYRRGDDEDITTADLENASVVARIRRGLFRRPGIIEQIRAAKSCDDARAIVAAHSAHATPKIVERWVAAASTRCRELSEVS